MSSQSVKFFLVVFSVFSSSQLATSAETEYWPMIIDGQAAVSRAGPRNAGFSCASLIMPPFCKVSPDCLEVSCDVSFAGQQHVEVSFKINHCANPLSVEIKVKVPALNLDVTEVISAGIKFPIPGFSVDLGFFKGGAFKLVELRPQGDNLFVKCELLAGGKLGFWEIYPLRHTVLNHLLPIKVQSCGGGVPPPVLVADSSVDEDIHAP